MRYYQKFYTDFKTSFYLYFPLGVIASSCIGSVAAMLILMKGYGFFEMLQVFLVTCVCLGFNATALANLKPKIIFNTLLISLAFNILLITLHIIF